MAVGRNGLWCWLVVLEYGKQLVVTLQSSVGKWFDLQTVVVNMAGTFLPFPLCYRLLGWAVLCWRGMLGPNVIGGGPLTAWPSLPWPIPLPSFPPDRLPPTEERHVRTWKPLCPLCKTNSRFGELFLLFRRSMGTRGSSPGRRGGLLFASLLGLHDVRRAASASLARWRQEKNRASASAPL
jgi:hypothetical protein